MTVNYIDINGTLDVNKCHSDDSCLVFVGLIW